MQISQFFLKGDMQGAIAYMRDHEEFKDILPAYVAILKMVNTERMKYRTYSTISCVYIRFIFVISFIAGCRRQRPRTSC